jgi:hypothetical protein
LTCSGILNGYVTHKKPNKFEIWPVGKLNAIAAMSVMKGNGTAKNLVTDLSLAHDIEEILSPSQLPSLPSDLFGVKRESQRDFRKILLVRGLYVESNI